MRKMMAALALVVLASACGQVEDDSAAPTGPTVSTRFGAVTVPAEAKRVVALGWSDAETALALGVSPIAASDWLAFGGEGVGPWAAGKYSAPPKLLGTQELNYDDIYALKPDLILNTRSDNSKEVYDELTKIAPTVSAPEEVTVAYGTTWRQQMDLVSAALNKKSEGDTLIAEVEAKLESAKAPAFTGRTVAVGAHFSDQYGAYVRGDSRADLMESLGFTVKPEIQALATDSFYVQLSREQVELLDADLTVVFPIGSDAEVLRADRVLNQIPSALAGHLVILDDQNLINAFSSGSTLGTMYAVDNAVPLFTEALG